MTKNIGVSAHLSMRKERLLYSKKLVNSFVIRPLQPLISIFTYTIFYMTVPKKYRNHQSPACMRSHKTALLMSSVLLWKHWRQRRNTSHHSKYGEVSRREESPGSPAKKPFQSIPLQYGIGPSWLGVQVPPPVTLACVLPPPIP